jgi:hypothetical protein
MERKLAVGAVLAAVAVALAALAAGGCAAAKGPPRGPKYEPANTPEAESRCPSLAEASKKAREAALGEESRELRAAAARAVFEQAECERKVFDTIVIGGATPEDFKLSVGEAKAQFYTALNLYTEAAGYDIAEWAVAGYARAGDLHAAYADKLRKSDPGPGVEGGDRALWLAEVEQIAAPVDQEAAQYWSKALDVVELGPPQFKSDPLVAPYVQSSCAGLRALGQNRC